MLPLDSINFILYMHLREHLSRSMNTQVFWIRGFPSYYVSASLFV